ncbi:NADAR family protein [Micromonospora sp. NPDC050417]|uniref:NADAR family protein n=1 Tax=Micromonospora sp. NPDC050417 TaxID=3364280 RepID=UPI0037AE31E7
MSSTPSPQTHPRDVAQLSRALADGVRLKFVFFWKHRSDGVVDAGCLSQWAPSPFTVDGLVFATAEHYMMWRKATLFGDAGTAERILAAGHPHRAQTLGRQVAGFDQRTWEKHRYDIVVAASVAKFGQDPALCEFLLGTGDRVLVEASPVDRIWGVGLAGTDPDVAEPERWRGLNLLGFALMDARASLREPTIPTANG